VPSEPSARAVWEEQKAAELARWTPAMHVAAKALADARYPSGKAAIEAAMKGTHRVPGAADRDEVRHPAETMAFFGLEPTMTVLDVDPGTGWYTELLAPALARQGRYLATGQYPTTAAGVDKYAGSHWSTFASEKFAAFLAKAPELYGKVETVSLDYGTPKLAIDGGTVDMVLMMREVHMMRNWGTLATWLAEALRVLKPGGILGIVDHRAAPDAAIETCSNFGPGGGRLPEAWVIAQVQAAGFSLVAKSEVNANPKDTGGYEKGVWTLPPEFALGDKDHDRYAAIGESDRMTLKFVKPR
jgi:predicted methyltransferase